MSALYKYLTGGSSLQCILMVTPKHEFKVFVLEWNGLNLAGRYAST